MVSRKIRWLTIGSLLPLLAVACTLEIPGQDTLFVRGEPFVMRGTAATIDSSGPCRVWIGDNGITYHLFQSVRLASDEFDRVATPGVTSRLQLATRNDLKVDCQVGDIVEVERVLDVEN